MSHSQSGGDKSLDSAVLGYSLRHLTTKTPDSALWDQRSWCWDQFLWTLDQVLWTLDQYLWTLDQFLWTLDQFLVTKAQCG